MVTTDRLELRPAWRTQWFLMLLILVGIGLTGYVLAARPPVAEEWPVAAVLAGLTLVLILVLVYRRFVWKFTIDEGMITRHYGIIARNQQSVRIRDLRSVELDQGLFQRLFNVGDLAFYSAGSATAEVRFQGIKSPADVRDHVHQMLDTAHEQA